MEYSFITITPSSALKQSLYLLGLHLCDLVIHVLHCDTVVTDVELQSHYYVNFWNDTFMKGMKLLIAPGKG